jgi:hypothetical protein
MHLTHVRHLCSHVICSISIEYLVLPNNSLHQADVLNEFGELSNLKVLDLSSNIGLQGTIPNSLAGLSNLGKFCLRCIFDTCYFRIPCPSYRAPHSPYKKVQFNILQTQITGTIPASVCDINNRSLQIQVNCTRVNCSCCEC